MRPWDSGRPAASRLDDEERQTEVVMPLPVFVALALLAVVVCVIFNLRAAGAEKARLESQNRTQELEKRLTGTQEELNGLREDLKRKSLQLEEARDKVQKAKRK